MLNILLHLKIQDFRYCLNTRSLCFLPAVSLSFSSKTVFVTPSLARWYNVWQPRLPPPIINWIMTLKDCSIIKSFISFLCLEIHFSVITYHNDVGFFWKRNAAVLITDPFITSSIVWFLSGSSQCTCCWQASSGNKW